MPTFSLFPKSSPEYSDLQSPVKSSRSHEFTSQHSPSSSFCSMTSMTESMYSATSTAYSSLDSPSYPMPLRIKKRPERNQVSFSDLPREKIRHSCLEKPLPMAPSPTDRLSKQSSFHARRPAPRPPVESWIDWSEDDSDDDDMEVKAAPPRPTRSKSMRVHNSSSSYPSLGSIEEEIMGMLQVEGEDKRHSIQKLRGSRIRSRAFGDFVGRFRRSLTLSDHGEWRGDKRGTYFDYMI